MPECLDTMPWRSIKGLGEMASHFLKVGDYKNERLTDGTPVQFRIIGFNHDKTRSGMVAPITWEMTECLPEIYPWNQRNTNEGSWPGCYLRGEMNNKDGAIYRLMPESIIQVATPVIKLTANTYDRSNEILESEDLFWIKSVKEMYGRPMRSAKGEGHWYEWYRQEDTPWGKTRNGEGEYTMLRSPGVSSTTAFWGVSSGGSLNSSGASYALGVCPCFST